MLGPSMRRRRLGLRLSAMIALFMVLNLIIITQTRPGSAAEQILLGAAPSQIDGSRIKGIEQIEDQIGRQLGLVRDFERWDSTFPSSFTTEMLDGDRTLLVSVRAKKSNGTVIKWRDIADAPVGSDLHDKMVEWVDDIGSLGVPVWFTFNHEPETSANLSNGDSQDFIDAWRRFVDEFRARGVDNVEFAWIMTHWAFEVNPSDRRAAEKWYPGDDYVDYIGSDAYNWGDCRDSSNDSWRSLEDTLEPQRQFGLAHPDKKLILGEVASTELGDGGAAKAAWLGEAKELFKKPGWEKFVAIAFFNVVDGDLPNCDWMIDSTPTLAAFVDLANDSYFGGSNTQPPPPEPEPDPAGEVTFVVGDPTGLSAGEEAVKGRFETLGYSVGLADDDFIDSTTGSSAQLIMVSSSVSDVTVGATFRDAPVPVWMSKPWLFDDMGMTGPVGDLDYGSVKSSAISVDGAAGPLAGGIDGAVILTDSSMLISFGKPAGDSTVVANVAGLATTFVYEKGSTLADGSQAAGCRLASSTFQDGPANFTADGWTLFDAAAAHALAGCPSGSPPPEPEPEPEPEPNPLPTVEITAPGEGATVAGTVRVEAEATDSDGVVSVEFAVDGVALGVDNTGTNGWSVRWDTSSAEGVVTLTATATDGLGASATTSSEVTVQGTVDEQPDDPPADGSVVMVVGKTSLSNADDAIKSRLESLGQSVTVLDDDDAAAADTAGAGFLFISSSVDSRKVRSAFAASVVPVVVAQPWLFGDMGMTGSKQKVDYGATPTEQVEVAGVGHPLAAGFDGGVSITGRRGPVAWGVPSAAASIVATANGKATIFAYEVGADLSDGAPSAGCRIAFPAFKEAPNNFTAEAWALFDAAAGWATGGC